MQKEKELHENIQKWNWTVPKLSAGDAEKEKSNTFVVFLLGSIVQFF